MSRLDEIRARHEIMAKAHGGKLNPRGVLRVYLDRAYLLDLIDEIGNLPDKWAAGERYDNDDMIEARRDCADELDEILKRDES